MVEYKLKNRPFPAIEGRLSHFRIWSFKAGMLNALCHSSLHRTVLMSIHCCLLTVALVPHRGNKYRHMNGIRDDIHV